MQFSEAEIEQIITREIFELTYKKISSLNEELIDSGILTSITLAELAVVLEKKLAVNISFMEINAGNFRSVLSIKNLILKK